MAAPTIKRERYPPSSRGKVSSPSSLRSIANALSDLFAALRILLTVAYVRSNRFLCNAAASASTLIGLTAPRYASHRVVLIGDGLALGLGDDNVRSMLGSDNSGIAPHLRLLSERDASVRTRWKVVNRGEIGSTADMWLPSPPLAPDGGGGGDDDDDGDKHSVAVGGTKRRSGGLFERVFGPGRIGHDADVVVLLVGTADVCAHASRWRVGGGGGGADVTSATRTRKRHGLEAQCADSDDEDDENSDLPPDLAKNIGYIAGTLQQRGHEVCVVELASAMLADASVGSAVAMTTTTASRRESLKLLNRRIRRSVSDVNQAALAQSKNGDGTTANGRAMRPIRFFPMDDHPNVMRPEYRSSDSCHFNREGYKQLACALFRFGGVREMMISSEWRVWRAQLNLYDAKKFE